MLYKFHIKSGFYTVAILVIVALQIILILCVGMFTFNLHTKFHCLFLVVKGERNFLFGNFVVTSQSEIGVFKKRMLYGDHVSCPSLRTGLRVCCVVVIVWRKLNSMMSR
jgi:hypothetical protein